MRQVFGSYDEAKQHEVGQKRAYRVSLGEKQVFAVALSPRHAMGEAGPELGLKAELCDRRPPTRRDQESLDAFISSLTEDQRAALREHLQSTVG